MKYSSGIMQKTAHRTLHSDAFRDLPYHAATGMQPGASKHTFYVDNLFVFQPLPYVKNLYYKNVNFYHYFIGRDDQSVNEKS